MSPQEKPDETLELDSISPNSNRFVTDKIRVLNREKRLMLYHLVVHILAFIIVIPFILMISLGINIPETYSTIVSVVVGFYFARALFN